MTAPGFTGSVTITIDEAPLWSAHCDPTGICPQLAEGDGPNVTFVVEAPSKHTIKLITSPHTSWKIQGFDVNWQPLPTQIQGIAYSPFRDCQNPLWGPYPTEQQIREDLLLVRHMGNAIRTYSSTGIQGMIPSLARQAGLHVFAGAWLGKDRLKNAEEITAVIKLAQTTELDGIIVGNEVLLRGDLPEQDLIAAIEQVRSAVDVPVTTAEIGAILKQHPAVMDAVTFQMVHLYAYWDGIPIENAARAVVDQYHEIQALSSGKRVIIGETGWPSAGPRNGHAETGLANQRRFLREFLTLAQAEAVEFLYFAGFDELWKTEGGVGPFWGFADSQRHSKYDLQSVLVPLHEQLHPIAAVTPMPTGTPGPIRVDTPSMPVYTTYAAQDNHFAPSGWMGDISAIHFSDCSEIGEGAISRGIEVRYTPLVTDTKKWAGIYWQQPENNWGDLPGGYDLNGYTKLSFRARTTTAGTVKIRFFVGGIANDPAKPQEPYKQYPSSITRPLTVQGADSDGYITLTRDWQTFVIDLSQADLSHVIDGFGWVADYNHVPTTGAVFYLDDIVFEQ